MTSGMWDLAIAGLENVLKTGIATAPQSSNVAHNDGPAHLQGLHAVKPRTSKEQVVTLSKEAALVLERLKVVVVRQHLPTLQLSATAHIGGYMARMVSEQIECDDCCTITTKAMSKEPLQKLTRYQDRRGPVYLSNVLLYFLDTLRELVKTTDSASGLCCASCPLHS